jgi:RHS repeat-associated protein
MISVHYLWDPVEDNIVRELDDAGTVVVDYTTEPDHFGSVISQRRGGQSSYFHHDGLGSTVAVTDESATVPDTRAYSAFGETTASSGSTVFPFQYVGQAGYYGEDVTGQFLLRRRMYKPLLGRFLSRDPSGLSSGNNLFNYCGSNPIGRNDPSGLIPFQNSGMTCAPEDDAADVECSGACFLGKNVTITKCEFSEIIIEKGSDAYCQTLFSWVICGELKRQFANANEAAKDLEKYPGGIWKINKCSKGCECAGGKGKKGKQSFPLKKRTIHSTGDIIGVGEVTCKVTLTGTIEIDADSFALLDCKPPKK